MKTPSVSDLLIVVPFFGDLDRFRPMLAEWDSSYKALGLRHPVVMVSDRSAHAIGLPEIPSRTYDLSTMIDIIRPNEPFDIKGALVCQALLEFPDRSLLVMDLDTVFVRDPAVELQRFAGCSIAMPIDQGALVHGRTPFCDPPYGHLRKLCAGVMFFGSGVDRAQLVDEYRRAWSELDGIFPWDPPHPWLLEQYAWALAHRVVGGRILPQSFNWGPHFLGESPQAVINHFYGFAKFRRARMGVSHAEGSVSGG